VVDFYVEQGFPRERTSVIYNGIDVPGDAMPESEAPAAPQTTRDELIERLGLPADARLIGFVGRLAKQRRIEDLLWAMQIARQANERAYLRIVGDGPERSALEQHARDVEVAQHVRFLGHRD